MTKTKPMTDEWKQIEVISKSSPELLKIVGKHSTLWNYSKLETIEKINDLIDQATSKAREEELKDNLRLAKDSLGHHCDTPNCNHNLESLIAVLEHKSLIQKDK